MRGFSSWYIAWLLFSLRLLAKFEFPARRSNKTCLNFLFYLDTFFDYSKDPYVTTLNFAGQAAVGFYLMITNAKIRVLGF